MKPTLDDLVQENENLRARLRLLEAEPPQQGRRPLLVWLTAENRARLERARIATGRTFARLVNDLIEEGL